jgi:aspartate/methionine/tyrosine aminotransferase
MKELNSIVNDFRESIFSTMTKMAISHQAINLSQGFPDFDGPQFVINYAKHALDLGDLNKNQYAPSMGILPLREAIAKNYSRFYKLDYNPNSEIVITNGATEAIFCTILATVNPGDEVIVLEPFYDSYLATLKIAGAKVIPITLKKPNFNFDFEELKNAVSKKTKLLILNNPHNPTGKVFSNEEINFIGKLAIENDFYLLSDEVYEFLTYDVVHHPTATFSNLFDRTITISSTGKTFGLTGWKIGWAAGPEHIIKAIHNVHQFSTFCVSHPFQVAMTEALNHMDQYLIEFKADYRKKRDMLVNGLSEVGFNVINPQGTYFTMGILENGLNDVEYCKELILNKKVAAIPTSAFYIKSNEGQSMIRFCFAKKEETLKAALKNLK